jgi:hypothetical protein
MVWFNRETRDWVVSFSCTGYGTQVGMSTYVGTRADADETAARYMAAAAAAGEHGRVDEWDY